MIATPACETQQDADVSLIFGNGTAPYTINWSSGGMGITEEGLTNGQYSVTVEDANGCNASQDFSISLFPGLLPVEIAIQGGDTICAGEFVTLTASGANTGIFEWSNGFPTSVITVSPMEETNYIVSSSAPGQELIVNGDFEQGNIGFTSDHDFHQLPSNGMCQSCYGVAPSPPDAWTQCGDHTSGGGNQMVFNAATTPGLSSWCQTISVTPNTDYNFSFWAQTINSGSPADLSVSFNNTAIPGSLPLGATSCESII